jgi:PAS domain S-box-containing protein
MKERIKILFVEDDLVQLKPVLAILEKEGYIVETANDGKKAMDYLKSESGLPDLILSDIFMPNMNGFELCVEVKKSYPNIPFIMLTVHNDDGNLQKAFESNALDYLGKPFTKTELLMRITNVLLQHNTEMALIKEVTELNQMLDAVNDMMRVIDFDFNILRITNSMADMLGLNKKEIIGRKCYNIFPGNQCRTEDCPVNRMLREKKKFAADTAKENEDCCLNGIVSVTPLNSKKGETIGIIEVFDFNSEKKLF